MGRGVIKHTKVNYNPPTPPTQANKKKTPTQKGEKGKPMNILLI